MAEFVNPFSGVVPSQKISMRELTRAIRLSLTAEHEAVHLYEAIADATDNKLAKEVLQDIANEERVHAGEFQRLLEILLPDERKFLDDGAAEVNEMAETVGGGKSETAQPVEAEAEVKTVGNLKS